MFNEDEEELELLRQYENKDLAEDDDHLSSDEMDSDLEDKIMSMVQYGTGIAKKKAPPSTKNDEHANEADLNNAQAKVVYAPMDSDKSDEERPAFSSANEFCIDNTDSDDDTNPTTVYSDDESDKEQDAGVPELAADVPIKKEAEQPRVTRYIDMDQEDKRYLDDQDTSEEEAELGQKLQKLIDDQIYRRQCKKRFLEKPVRVCFSCNQPGHERIDCRLCSDCGGPRHKEGRCVGARYCTRCKYRGHNAIDCENSKTLDNCSHCNATYHHTNMCPGLLHTYVGERASKSVPTAWCYNCTERGHYGDECLDLPQYKITMPSAFSKLSLGIGSRFDSKKTKEFSYQQGYSSKRQRRPEGNIDSSPRYDYHDSGYNDNKRTRHKYFDSDDEYPSRHSRSGPSKNNKSSNLNGFFSHQLPQSSSSSSPSSLSSLLSKNRQNDRSGNSNWKAMNNNSLPQPTRSGTVSVNSYNNSVQQRREYGDFPRNSSSNLPKPSSSGVIDLSGSSSNSRGGKYTNRGPKYHGGYSRNR
ncbi:hypothetical protein BD408DRAFT_479485 [Parasitella parasitica]|nr:hypothetical protein BD408DRAFT_479485 [Parasitella parasitica]